VSRTAQGRSASNRLGPHRVEQFCSAHEHHPGAGAGEHPAAPSGIDFEIVAAAFDGAKGDRVNHQERFKPRLDREQALEARLG
jgi:hypothetical protein